MTATTAALLTRDEALALATGLQERLDGAYVYTFDIADVALLAHHREFYGNATVNAFAGRASGERRWALTLSNGSNKGGRRHEAFGSEAEFWAYMEEAGR